MPSMDKTKYPAGVTPGEAAWMLGTILGGLLPVSVLMYGKQHMDGRVSLDREAMLADARQLAKRVYEIAMEDTHIEEAKVSE